MSIQQNALLATDCRADEDIEWRQRVAHGAVTLFANSLDVASRTGFYVARGFAADVIRPYPTVSGSFRLTARYHDEKGAHEIVLDNLVCGRD